MKKFLKIALISVMCFFVLFFAVVYVLLTQIDFNAYRDNIVKIVRSATGRELTIGDIQVKPSFNPVIEVKNVTFSNAEWAKEPLMASVESVDLGFAILPLLHKSFEIDTFTLGNAVINLEESADGQTNWTFTAAETGTEVKPEQQSAGFSLIGTANAAEGESAAEAGGSDIADQLSDLVIKHVYLDNVQVNYTDKTAKNQSYNLKKLALDENDDDNIDFSFNVNDGLYSGDGFVGGTDKLKDAEGYPVSGKFEIAGIRAETVMTLFDLFGNLRFDGTVVAKQFLGNKYGESAEIALKGDLQKINATVKSFVMAENVITGSADVDLSATVPDIKADLSSAKIDIAAFTAKKQTAAAFSLIKEAKATALVPDDTVPYKSLYSANADINMTIGQLVNGKSEIAKNLSLNANLTNGTATVKVLKGSVAGGEVSLSASLAAATKALKIKTDMKKINMQQLLQVFGATSSSFNFVSGSETDFYADLTGQGNTYPALIDSLNGRVVAIVDKSQLHLGNISLMKGNIISQLLNTLQIAKDDDDLNLSCAVVRADLKDGKAEFPNGIVVNADKFTVVANGDINLKKDSISLSVKPFAGKLTDTNIAKALSSLVKLTGTLQKPKIGVDSANAIKTIVGVTTAGPVYLGTQMLLENDGSPCYTALDGTGYESRFPKSDNIARQTTDGVDKILDDSVDVVKGTTKGLLNMLSGGTKK